MESRSRFRRTVEREICISLRTLAFRHRRFDEYPRNDEQLSVPRGTHNTRNLGDLRFQERTRISPHLDNCNPRFHLARHLQRIINGNSLGLARGRNRCSSLASRGRRTEGRNV